MDTNEAALIALNSEVVSNTLKINTLNTSVSNINSTLTSQLGLININATNISLLSSATNSTFAAQLATLNTHTTNISSLNNSVSNINSTLTSQLGLINTTNTNLSLLTASTNNTFASQLALINSNGSSISTLNSNIVSLSSSTTLTSQLGLINITNTNLSLLIFSTNNTFVSQLALINNSGSSISTLNTSVANINSTLTSQLPNLATQTYVKNAISNLVGAAPAALDTLYELASATSNNSIFSTTVLNAVANVGTTASTALNTTNSIITLLPCLATKTHVDNTASDLQPLDANGTLAAIPNNALASNAYFSGFPIDQATYTITSGASSTNLLSLSGTGYQQLTFPSTSSTVTIVCPNTYPVQSCIVSVSVMLGSATSFILSVAKSGTTYATNQYDSSYGLYKYSMD